MNYKVMQRPMFRLGGGVIKGKKVGDRENFATITEIEDLINKRAGIRDKALSSMGSMLPLQVLAGQGDNIRTISSLGDVTNILSNLGTDPNTFAALGKLNAIDLKKTEGELSDKITLAKLKNKMAGSSTRLKSEAAIRRIETKIISLENAKKALEGQKGPEVQKKLDEINENLRVEKQSLKAFINENLRIKAVDALTANMPYGSSPSEEDILKQIGLYKGTLAEGGRVGYQDGTPNPDMVMPQPKPQEVMDDRKLDTLMTAAPAMEDPNQARSMSDQDMYAALRRRLPPEITDDVVRLIAYNQEAFADFANISDQSDVESFNQKYNVELVLPVGNQ